MSTVRVGSARRDENGKYAGGRAGDQDGVEISSQSWYLHSKGWKVLRCKDVNAAEKIAHTMEQAIANAKIGYDQDDRMTLYKYAKKTGYDLSKITTACECDCSSLVAVCVLAAGISCDPELYTGNLADELLSTGRFELLTADKYCKSSAYLLRGDILVTKTKGHTVIVLDDGDAVAKLPTAAKTCALILPLLARGSKVSQVNTAQILLKHYGYYEMDIDQSFGGGSERATKAFQEDHGLKATGQIDLDTWAALLKG